MAVLPGDPTIAGAAGSLRFTQTLRGSPALQVAFEPTLGITAKRLADLGVNIRSFREPLELSIREVMRPSIKTNFQSGGRPKWRELAESTLARRRQEHTGSQILVATGRLQRLASQRNIWSISTTAAVVRGFYFVEQRAGYGAFHQTGTKRPIKLRQSLTGRSLTIAGPGSMPARPFLMIQEEDIVAIEKIFLKWLEMRVARYWAARV